MSGSDDISGEDDESGYPVFEDFLLVAGEMEGFSLPVIAAALSYKKEDYITALELSEKDSKRDKIAQLFIGWKNENKKEECTWNSFMKCLQHLNSKELAERVDRIRHKRDNIDREPLQLNFTQEIESYSVESAENVFQEPMAATAEQKGPSSMVTGSEGASNAMSMKYQNHLENKLSLLQRKFTRLQTALYSSLSSSDKIEEIKVYIASRLQEPITNDGNILSPLRSEIIIKSTLSEVFQYLSIHGYWNFLNYYLIEELVTEFHQSTSDKMKEYEDQVKEFREETKLCDFLEIWPKTFDEKPYEDMGIVITKLRRNWESCTLQAVVDAQEALAGVFKLKKFLFIFCEANKGCVELKWLVPQPCLSYMKREIRHMHGVTCLSNDKDIFRVKYSELEHIQAEDLIHNSLLMDCSDASNSTSAFSERPGTIPPKAASFALRRLSTRSSSSASSRDSIGIEDPKEYVYRNELAMIDDNSDISEC